MERGEASAGPFDFLQERLFSPLSFDQEIVPESVSKEIGNCRRRNPFVFVYVVLLICSVLTSILFLFLLGSVLISLCFIFVFFVQTFDFDFCCLVLFFSLFFLLLFFSCSLFLFLFFVDFKFFSVLKLQGFID